ncbi:hypothetical protein Drorol1_Dr00012875 [Drosera rotundifolia]
MGKPENEVSVPAGGGGVGGGGEEGGEDVRRRVCGSRCLMVVLLGIGVFVSWLFWLPPFLDHSDLDDPDMDPRFRGYEIVASFKLEKPMSSLQDNMGQLEADILDEIEVPDAKVVILSLESSYGSKSNITSVVFGIDLETKDPSLSIAALSLIRDSFESLVVRQSSLKLTASLFGEPYFFEVLKFPGGITVTPPQIAFLLQKFHLSFNFTLSFSIYEIQENFDELKSQLRSGLHLASYENLYISLTNSRGSTVDPPATVESHVLMAVGITPSKQRLKQLAQTIKNSHERNLGLNHTVFGKVKQVSLSSTLQHLLNGSDTSGTSEPPAPAPTLSSYHNGRHHDSRQHRDPGLAPVTAPSPLPLNKPEPVKSSSAPQVAAISPAQSSYARPPRCRFGFKRQHTAKAPKGAWEAPVVAPKVSPYHSAFLPRPQARPPASVSTFPSSSPLPHAILAHANPRSGSGINSEPPSQKDVIALSPVTSGTGSARAPLHLFALFTALLLRL